MNRAVEFAITSGLLVALAPLFFIIAIANRLFTGAVLFRQIRVGSGMRPFTILKFQTMVTGSTGSTITLANDERVTRLGRLLRALKLDELPQLVNVLRGEMSLVGPRALPPIEIERIPPEVANLVYSVRPGMTGVAGLVYLDEEHRLANAEDPAGHYFDVILPEKMALEVQYVRRRSLRLDFFIMACTLLAIASPALPRRLLGTVGGFVIS